MVITRLTFSIGLPAGIQQILVSLSSLVVGALVNSFGAVVVAGFGVAARLDQFAFMPSMSVSLAVSALVGQNLGAGRTERVGETVRWSMLLSGSITLLVALVALLRPDLLLRVFTSDGGVVDVGSQYLRFVALSYLPMALMFTVSGALRGAGDTMATMVLTLLSLWVVRVPTAKYLSSLPALGVVGIWIALAVTPVAGLIMHWAYYRTGRWKSRVVTRNKGDLQTQPAGH